MKIGIDLQNTDRRNKLAAVLAGQGHQVVTNWEQEPISMSDVRVAIVETRYRVSDCLDRGKIVILFTANEATLFDALMLTRFKNRLFICRPDSGPYGGIGEVLAAVAKIANRSK